MENSEFKNKENHNNLKKEEIIDNYNIVVNELKNIKDFKDNNIYKSNINIEKEKIKSSLISKDLTKKKSSNKLLNKKTFLLDIFDKEKEKINFIHELLNEFKGRNSLIKRACSMPELSYKDLSISKTEEEPPTPFLADKKSNIKELNNLNVIIGFSNEKIIEEQNEDEDEEESMTTINIEQNINQNNLSNKNNNRKKKDEEEEYEKSRINLRSRSFYKEKEMTSDFYEENEHKNYNIRLNNITNKIERISSNLMLKKIIFDDLLKKQADSIYYFCQQCFCFIKTDIFFGKILSCYKYYRERNIPIEKITNLIDFLNALIIEMYEYYKGLPKDDDIQLIKDIYNTILTDLIINNNNNNSDAESCLDKNKIINENLNNEEDKKICLDNNIENEKQNSKKEESMFFDKDYIVIEKDKDSFDVYNEEKVFNQFIYETFIQETFDCSKCQNYENFSIINPIENLLINLKEFLDLFKSKKPSYHLLLDVKNSISFYKYLKEEEIHKNMDEYYNNNILRRSKCYTCDENFINNKNSNQRKNLLKGIFSILDWKTEEIGEELIRVSTKLLKKIEKRELYKAIYLKNDKDIKSPNVIRCINNFNKLTFFIIEDIISYDHASDRAKVIDKWAQIAEYCKSRKDYNDCIAINSALNSYIITGLNLTNKQIKYYTNTLLKDIGSFCSCNGNYKNIREEIQNLNNKKEIFYPYLGMMLRDITFFEEKSKYLIEGEIINFTKIENIQNIMESNFRFKNMDNSKIINNKFINELSFFEDLEMNTEENLESIANQIEPNFTLNDGKKGFKRKTKIDEKYFNKFKNPLLLRKSTTNTFLSGK